MIPGLLLLTASIFTVTNSVYRGPVKRPANAVLVWRDEFTGAHLDSRKWQYDVARNKRGWFNRELQYYSNGRPENAGVANGLLTITARHEKLDPRRYPDWGGQNYTSTKIFSKGAGWTYGFYEIRAKLPCARGTWPAIWMLPVDMKKWPDDGEIDIMEHVGWKPHELVSSLHTGLFNFTINTQRSAQRIIPTSCSAFHVYQLDWRPDSITIGADGRGIMRVLNNRPGGK